VERPGAGCTTEAAVADGYHVLLSGALEFVNGDDVPVIVYAPHAWSTVVPAEGS
jgi:hypothetical protein